MSHCSNWSRTSSTFRPGPSARPLPQRGQGLDQAGAVGQGGAGLAQPAQQPGLGLLGGRLDVDRQHDACDSRGSSPALTSDDLPQPEGP